MTRGDSSESVGAVCDRPRFRRLMNCWAVTDRPYSVRAVVVLSLIIVAICYANAVHNEFISDDYFLVALNPAIRTFNPLEYFSTPFWGEKGDGLGIYRPLVIFTFSLEYQIWQRWAPGFHIVNMLLHALNGVLVFFLARSLVSRPVAWWAAMAIYLAHPVHTEAVAAIAGRSELLSATFFFSAWLLFRRGKTAFSALAFFVSLLSKENAISFPLVIVLVMWAERQRDSAQPESAERQRNSAQPKSAERQRDSAQPKSMELRRLDLKPIIPLAASAVIYLVLRLWVLGAVGMPVSAQYMNGRWTWLERELTSGRSFLKYFELLLAPVELAGNYDFNSIPIAGPRDWDAWLGIVLIAGTMLIGLRLLKTWPAAGFGILFFYVTMLPMSNWIIPTGVTVAERYLYVPVFGFSLILAIAWTAVPSPYVRRILAAGVLSIAALLCMSHNYAWRDEFTYYGNMARVLPNNARARQGYGIALLEKGRITEAREQFEAGLRILRNTPLLVGMAGVLIQTERSCKSAVPLLNEALGIQPKDYFARWTLAECLESDGRLAEAEETYRHAIDDAQFPDPKLLTDWGASLERLGRLSEAMDAYRRAAAIDPNDPWIQAKLQNAAR